MAESVEVISFTVTVRGPDGTEMLLESQGPFLPYHPDRPDTGITITEHYNDPLSWETQPRLESIEFMLHLFRPQNPTNPTMYTITKKDNS